MRKMAGALALFLVLLIAPATGRAQDAQPAWPVDSTPPLVTDPTVTWGRLANGLRYAIMPNQTPPGRVSLRLLIEAGSLMENEDQRGLAHFLEHMAFKGSKNIPPGEFVTSLQRLGLAFGPDTNAATGFDSTTYMLELPGNGHDLVDNGISILSEVAGRLLLDPAQIDSERGVILSERRVRNTPGQRQSDALLQFMLQGTRFPDRQPIGLENVIQTAPRDRFLQFYHDFYTPERAVVIVVGDIDVAAARGLIEQHFADLAQPANAPADPPAGTLTATGADATFFSDPGLPTTVSLMHASPADNSPDSIDRVRRRIVESLGQLMLSRRLQSLALTPGSAFTQAGASSSELKPAAKIAAVTMLTTPERWQDALATGEQELRRALKFGFGREELDQAIAIYRNAYETQLSSAATRSSAELASSLINTILDDGVFTDPKADLALFDLVTRDLEPQGARDALATAWGTGEVRIMLSGPFQLDDARQKILAAYDQSRAVAVTPPEQAKTPPFAYTDFGPSSGIAEATTIDDLGIVAKRFGNGVRLDMKRTDFEADTIQVGIRFGDGRIGLPKDQPGLDLLANWGFIEGGLGKHDAEQLSRILAGKEVGVDLTVAESTLVLTGTTTRKDLEEQLQLMAAYVADPGFRPEALDRFRVRLDDAYRGLAASPAGLLGGPIALLIHDDDPRFGMPPKEEAARRTLDELKAWLLPALTSGPLQVVLVGDIDPDEAAGLVGKTFGALPARGDGSPAPVPPRLQLPTAADPVRFYHQGPADQALSLVYWRTTDSSDTRRDRGLDIVADILGDRLLAEVRQREGATYSPEAANGASLALPGYGYLVASLEVAADSAERLNQLTRDIATRMRIDGITQDELDRAVQPRLAQAQAQARSNRYWAFGVLLGMHKFPGRLDAARSVEADLKSFDLASIDALAKEYLAPENSLRVVVLPEKLRPAE